ncbi:hypothetical protein KAR91_02065 [Candidatus Pacearchaeota archaeon]|nr:hypothetical protein [Candidatus Pacearchaeota archaeon]
MKNVTKHTKAGKKGKGITCPHCKNERTVYHFSWQNMICQECGATVNKTEFLLLEHEDISRRGGSAKTKKKTAACRKNASKPRTKTYHEGDIVKYIGKGFIRFDSSVTEVKILEIERYDLWVLYKGQKMLVRNCEVSPL